MNVNPAARRRVPAEPPDVMTIKDAAKILGVSEVTLRRWDASGKFPAHRHPVNGYRVYTTTQVLRMRKKIEGKGA